MKKLPPPTRFSSERHHRHYGLWNWFRLRGIPDGELQDEIINNYCEMNGFKPISRNGQEITNSKINFIHNRFQDFATWAGKNYQLMPVGGWSK